MRFVSSLLTLVLVSTFAFAQKGTIRGSVSDKRAQFPVIGAVLTIETTAFGAVTDTDGSFSIREIPGGSYNLRVQASGYEPLMMYNVVVTSGNENILHIELESGRRDTLKEVVVRKNPFSHSIETPLSVQSLSAQEIKSNPGGNFDISRVIQAFPGVGGTSGSVGGYRNDIIIRGGAPNENVYYIDGIEVPIINHFATQGSAGGPTGIINTSFIEDVNLYTGAFPAKYDNPLSGVMQMKMRDANPDKIQNNMRLSATEFAFSSEGPITDKISYEASIRRSYLQFLFKGLEIPIQPSYWDFQYKINYKINKKLTLYTIGIGAIDDFSFMTPKNLTPENVYILHSNPLNKQWSYTNGYGLKKLIKKGYWNLTFSRNMLVNQLDKYTDNQNPSEATRLLKTNSTEAETKLRFQVNKFDGIWSWSYGAMVQYDEFKNDLFAQLTTPVTDSTGNVIVPAVTVKSNTNLNFVRFGAHAQVAGDFMQRKLNVSLGVRVDGNTFTNNGDNVINQLSPRLSASYKLLDNLNFNASVGRYFKIPTYTVLGFTSVSGVYLNQGSAYTQCDHIVGGLEYLPKWQGARFTLEAFSKNYSNYPVSMRDGISLANKGGDFAVLGNEQVTTNGQGRAYGAEFQFQQKLIKNLFVVLSYTYYKSEFTNFDGKYVPASWDNRHLLSFIGGYKFKRNYELGVKFRYQGGAPYTPFDLASSQVNYSTLGTGVLDNSQFNTLRLADFNSMDIRLDKKWNYKKWTLDLFFDVTNAYAAAQPSKPTFTFKRTADNKDFVTTDGKPLKADGSNGVPLILNNSSKVVVPSLGFIVEF